MSGKSAVARKKHDIDGDALPEWFGVDVEDLSARLRFNPKDAHIWLGDERMMLMHVDAFAVVRQEIIDGLGLDEARRIFTRIGATAGARDAEIARKASPHAGPLEAFKAGPRLHAIEGVCAPDELKLQVDTDAGLLNGEWIWRNSAEAEAHVRAMGPSAEPICWMMLGYASAYSSAFMGHGIVFREVECRAMGAPHCRTIGKPAALWEEQEEHGRALGMDLAHCSDDYAKAVSEHRPDDTALDEWNDQEAEALVGRLTIVKRLMRLDEPVLLLGEHGVGKRRLALALHRLSHRRDGPLLVINCARNDPVDMELELFGREREGETPARPGKIERLKGGTIVLEDVEALSPRLQARFLQLLSEGTVERSGGGAPRLSDVRVIACATERLQQAVKDHGFRTDLFYRLSMFPVPLPPLRERRDELPRLIRHFTEHFARRYDRKILGLSREAMDYLLAHDYPGNIVELEAMLGRAVIMATEGKIIHISHLLSAADPNPPSFFHIAEDGSLVHPKGPDALLDLDAQTQLMIRGRFNIETFEAELVKRAVTQAQGNLSRAARLLGITRAQLAYRYARTKGDDSAD
ncbi:MAG: sigma 54-interacting transcriptional regulator [Sphingomonadaceae bacterium]|jgi:DNA-binding NtrC family response regulator/predicted hydrocarbon binding protein